MKYFTALKYNETFRIGTKKIFFFRTVHKRTFINVVTRHYSECDKTLK